MTGLLHDSDLVVGVGVDINKSTLAVSKTERYSGRERERERERTALRSVLMVARPVQANNLNRRIFKKLCTVRHF